MSTVDMFEDGNANMPLDIASEDDEDDVPDTQPIRQKKRRRRLVFSGGFVLFVRLRMLGCI